MAEIPTGTVGCHPAVEAPHTPGGRVSSVDVFQDTPKAMYEDEGSHKDPMMSLPGSVQVSQSIVDSTQTISLAGLPRNVPGTVPEESVTSQTGGLHVLGPDECQESLRSSQPANIRAWEVSQNEVSYQTQLGEHGDSVEAQGDVQVVLILNDSGNGADEAAVSHREAPLKDMVTNQDPHPADDDAKSTPEADAQMMNRGKDTEEKQLRDNCADAQMMNRGKDTEEKQLRDNCADAQMMNRGKDTEEKQLRDNCVDEVNVPLVNQGKFTKEKQPEDNCGADGSSGGSHSNGSNVMTNNTAATESMMASFCRSERITVKNTPSVQVMFQCDYCDTMFGRVESLRHHRETCPSHDPYRCGYCPKTFPTFKGLKEHQNLYTVDKPYQLGYCEEGFMGWVKSSEDGDDGVTLMDLDVPKDSETERKGGGNKQSPRATSGTASSEKSSVEEYKCDLCEETFPRQGLRYQHEIISHPERRPYKCDVCQRPFANTTYLRDHMVVHTGAKPYQCAHCEEVFSHRGTRSKHERKFHSAVEPETSAASVGLKEHHTLYTTDEPEHNYCKSSEARETAKDSNGSGESGNDVEMTETGGEEGKQSSRESLGTNCSKGSLVEEYKCDLCEGTYPKRYLLTKHEMSVHPELSPHKCDVCKKTFASKTHLRDHAVVHTGAKPFPCGYCEKAFGRKCDKSKHERVIHGASNERFQCDHCDRTFPNSSRMEAHLSSYLREPSRGTQRATGKKEDSWEVYGCSLCEKTFSRNYLRNRHETRAHPERRTHKCDVCQKMFVSESILEAHMVVHTGDRPFTCRHCPQVFGHKSTRRKHEMLHAPVKPFKCEYCDMTFVGEAYCKRHIATHIGAKPFHCDECGKDFKSKTGLRFHLRNHRGEKHFQCEICGKAFAVSSNLFRHRKTHQKTTRFKCYMCGEGFDQMSDFTEHKQIHTVVKSYQCDICGNTFRTSSHLHEHRRVHTKERPHKCDVCQKKYTRSSSLKKHKLTHGEEMALASAC